MPLLRTFKNNTERALADLLTNSVMRTNQICGSGTMRVRGHGLSNS
jgi:hypothetical protein